MNNTKHVVNFSGGACSFWAAVRVAEKHGTSNLVLLFADTLMEDEDLYRFISDAEQFIGVKVTRIADGRTPWELFAQQRMLGNSRADLCSRILKRELLDKWHNENCDPQSTVIYVGIDWTESHRAYRLRLRKPKWKIEAPMCDAPYWGKCKMLSELDKVGIKPPSLYALGFPHNNCGGFCIKAGQAHFAHLLRVMPERFAIHEHKEQGMREQLGKDVSILKEKKGGTTNPLTLRELRRRIESGEWYDRTEWGGCGCAIDENQSEFGFTQDL